MRSGDREIDPKFRWYRQFTSKLVNRSQLNVDCLLLTVNHNQMLVITG
jgi:hypothetical protein